MQSQIQDIVAGIMDHVKSRCKHIDTSLFLRKIRVIVGMEWPDDKVTLALLGQKMMDSTFIL